MALIVLSVPYWVPAVTPPIAAIVPLLALSVLLDLPTTCAPQIAAERPSWASLYSVSTSLGYFVCMGTPLVVGWGLQGFAYGLVASSLFRFSLFSVLVHAAVPKGPLRIDWKLLVQQVVYTAPLALSVASGVLNRYVDKWIVSALVPDQVGAHTFAATEVPFLTTVGYAMASILSTRVAFAFQSDDPDLARRYWISAATRGALFVGPATALVMLVAPEILVLFFDPSYSIALLPFQIYNLLLYRIMGYGMLLRSAGATRTLWLLSVSLLVLNAALGFPLTWAFGIAGAATGACAANLIVFAATLVAMARVLETRISQVMPWGRYGAALAVAAVGFAVATFVASGLEPAGLRLGAKASVFLVTYALVAWALRLYTKLPAVPKDSPAFTSQVLGRGDGVAAAAK